MRLLVLGGTVFLGRHVVAAAQAAGHAITIFHRGLSRAAMPATIEVLHGDRDSDVDALEGRDFDAAIDCSGYTPQQMTRVADALARRVGHYLFVSSRSVYRRFEPDRGFDEREPVLDGDEGYGALKARSEEAITAALPGRVTIVRPGLVVGPYDPTNRFTYWPVRLHRGGDVLAPGRPQRRVQFVDGRDLAAWCVALVGRPASGVYDVVGPTTTMGALLATMQRVIGGDARLHWIGDEALIAEGIEPWTALPLWLPESDRAFGGLMHGSDLRARAAGLVTRPIEETVRDTLAWALGPDAPMPRAVATLTRERERDLLDLAASTTFDPAP